MRASHQNQSAEASTNDAGVQNFLLDLATQLSTCPTVQGRIDCFCRALLSRLDASAVYYWDTLERGELQAVGFAGRALRPPQMPRLTVEVNPAAFEALRSLKPCLFPALHRPNAA